ncbi:protein-disulfide reductase DsbD family protein [Agriterribacter sp.]|uniref:protein-disulfide reductase DsbD family protein n=1 Tax=Agriterribacter sp. TaxID=2821509 RepID=UPI002B5CF7B4|nr:thioredoxin family protein [Agriterribacter sp.]HTN08755.1 thioredoxin family protein [Agriterribacter sp.]
MKQKAILLLFFLLPLFCIAQESPLHWEVNSTKNNSSSYTIIIKATLDRQWHVYADSIAEIEMEGLHITWDDDKVQKNGKFTVDPQAAIIKDPVFDNRELHVYTGNFTLTQKINITGEVPAALKIKLQGFASNNEAFTPVDEAKTVHFEGGITPVAASQIRLQRVDLKNPVSPCGDETQSGQGLLTIFFLGFIGGIIALLTPCVFPMIPVTVSFFTNRASHKKQAIRNGIIYGFFIFLIYVLASIPFHIIGNVQPEIFNNISTNAWLNVFFFAVFIFFAISFFGYFEITLPAGIAGKADAKSSLGSISGIFFMALTLVIVSFSCTGVILGTLLVGTASEGAWSLTSGMAGFGTALALPFALFAMFPNWLKSLPKSGGWLDTVKKILAFVELALAFKFLSNADLVEHWGLLKREVFIGIWLLIAIGLGCYLFGWLKLPHDYKGQKIPVTRKVLGVLSFIFAVYLVPGLTASPYANLKLLSGFPPPLSYSVYGESNVQGKGVEPHVINDFEKAMQLSAAQNKPILIDFTGWACVNCRKMEEQVWTDPEISSLLNEKFILLSLYVDDRKKLPPAERFTYTFADGKEKDIETIGDKWATFQTENFGKSTQPLYVILNHEGKLLTNPVGYTPDVKKYGDWLKCGLKAYAANQ